MTEALWAGALFLALLFAGVWVPAAIALVPREVSRPVIERLEKRGTEILRLPTAAETFAQVVRSRLAILAGSVAEGAGGSSGKKVET